MRVLLRAVWLAIARATARAHRRSAVRIGDGALFYGRPLIAAAPGGWIEIGAGARLVSRSRDTPFGVNHRVVIRGLHPGATISIGAGSALSGTTICAAQSISIGARCLLGPNVTIVDSDFHPAHSAARIGADIPTPRERDRVLIGDNVFLGTGSIILKGVTIGDNSVVGAGAVLTTDCPPNTIVAGNPARPVGKVRLPEPS